VDRLEKLEPVAPRLRPSPHSAVRLALERARDAPSLVLLLDYDGTLVPFATTPELAAPDPALLSLLRGLAARPATEVHVVSGRRKATLERWLGALPVGLHAEHGLWSRLRGGEWTGGGSPEGRWREQVRAILDDFAERTPGAIVEEKTVGFAWHWRAADPEFGAAQARELSLHLSALLTNAPVELLQGDLVVEVRPHGVTKGQVARLVAGRAPAGSLLAALGDDRTDEDLFAALPEGSLAVHVGPNESSAPLRLADVPAARAFLAALARA
jgi:trehalose 6-phosphate synthase/phosphatase